MGVSKIEVEVKGVETLNQKLGVIDHALLPALEKGVNLALAVVEGAAKTNCPVDTGTLRGSIHTHPAANKGKTVEGSVFTSIEYAMYVEFGTGRRGGYPYETSIPLSYAKDHAGQAAQPFLYPALLKNKDKVRRLIAESVNGIGANK